MTRAAVLLTLAAWTSACGLPQGSTSPTTTATGTTETFSGSLLQQSSNLFTFTVSQAGAVSVTLTSLGPAGAHAAPRDAVGQEALARAYTHATQVASLYALGALVLTALLVPFLPRRTPREGQAS